MTSDIILNSLPPTIKWFLTSVVYFNKTTLKCISVFPDSRHIVIHIVIHYSGVVRPEHEIYNSNHLIRFEISG